MPLNKKQLEAIKKTLPTGRAFFNFTDREDYTKDAVEEKYIPDALFFAETEADIVAAVNLCRENNIPLIMRGAGTGYSGGVLAVAGGLLLSIERMKKLQIHPVRRMAVAQPGVITAEIVREAEKLGLFYPPDPASFEESTIAGNVAENAGGLRGKKYGVTKDYVLGFRGVTADGNIVEINQETPFGLKDILIGSEGTLIIFTEICLRLIDLPQIGRTIQAVFDNDISAARTISEILADGIVPRIMEFMDGDAIACSNQYDPAHCIPEGAAMVLFETDGIYSDSEANHILEVCQKYYPTLLTEARSEQERDQLWRTRRDLSKAVKSAYQRKVAEDVCVPPSRLPELVGFVAELNRNLRLRVNCYGHAGDGNLHVNFLGMTGSPEEEADINNGVKQLFIKTIELGGTLSGEHGIGTTKKGFLGLEFDVDTIAFMKHIKNCFDPNQFLNPGKIFPE